MKFAAALLFIWIIYSIVRNATFEVLKKTSKNADKRAERDTRYQTENRKNEACYDEIDEYAFLDDEDGWL